MQKNKWVKQAIRSNEAAYKIYFNFTKSNYCLNELFFYCCAFRISVGPSMYSHHVILNIFTSLITYYDLFITCTMILLCLRQSRHGNSLRYNQYEIPHITLNSFAVVNQMMYLKHRSSITLSAVLQYPRLASELTSVTTAFICVLGPIVRKLQYIW